MQANSPRQPGGWSLRVESRAPAPGATVDVAGVDVTVFLVEIGATLGDARSCPIGRLRH